MTPDRIQDVLGRLRYQRDERRPPDERRRGQFRAGWDDASKRGEVYAESTLEGLTWHNLGYRLGQTFGSQEPERIDGVFDILADLYEEGHSENAAQLGVPAPEQYAAAFRKVIDISDTQIQMLRLHYNSPKHTTTAIQLAHAVGYSHYSISNSQYGRLGHLVGDHLEYKPTKTRLGTLVTFEKRQGEWHWIMRPEVAAALEQLGWVEGAAILLPEEIAAATTPLIEGAVCSVTVNAYERNPLARRRCILAHGARCAICGFNFGEAYGEVGDGYIHVHHLRPLSEIGGTYTVDPVKDLRPVCPNCHSMLHRRIPAFSIEDVRAFLGGRVVRAVAPDQPGQ